MPTGRPPWFDAQQLSRSFPALLRFPYAHPPLRCSSAHTPRAAPLPGGHDRAARLLRRARAALRPPAHGHCARVRGYARVVAPARLVPRRARAARRGAAAAASRLPLDRATARVHAAHQLGRVCPKRRGDGVRGGRRPMEAEGRPQQGAHRGRAEAPGPDAPLVEPRRRRDHCVPGRAADPAAQVVHAREAGWPSPGRFPSAPHQGWVGATPPAPT